jgi:hypothetical protein
LNFKDAKTFFEFIETHDAYTTQHVVTDAGRFTRLCPVATQALIPMADGTGASMVFSDGSIGNFTLWGDLYWLPKPKAKE